MPLTELWNTDPLAQGALVGLGAVIFVTLVLFGFLIARMMRKTRRAQD